MNIKIGVADNLMLLPLLPLFVNLRAASLKSQNNGQNPSCITN